MLDIDPTRGCDVMLDYRMVGGIPITTYCYKVTIVTAAGYNYCEGHLFLTPGGGGDDQEPAYD